MNDYFYILNEDHSVEDVSLSKYLDWIHEGGHSQKIIKQFETRDYKISTVFLGINHSISSENPLIFETMIFGGYHDGECVRYKTWQEAVDGHYSCLKMLGEVEIIEPIHSRFEILDIRD